MSCESCGQRRATVTVVYGDAEPFRVCTGCEPTEHVAQHVAVPAARA